MKKILSVIVLGLLFSVQACAQVELWQEGKHYQVISDSVSEKPVVTEYFSFWCPACYQFEPLVKQMKSKLDKDVKFNKVHVNFMGFTGREVQDMATKAMLIGRVMKQEDKYNEAIFDYIHRQRGSITEMKDLRNIFVVNGVDADKFDKLASGFSMNNLLNRNNKSIDKFRSEVTGVPTFIINEKYKATFTRDMTVDDMINLVVWLSKQK